MVRAASGDTTVGNFLDGVFFGTTPHVELSKPGALAGEVKAGHAITYWITARTEDGGRADDLTVTDMMPEGITRPRLAA
ncbi:hypothetical protein GCM10009647_086340 [Streptomyces sanglieri]|uniref:DUF11 domain-containing protein n=1 Tax=Streptomyces sanglieri TaxID=193460 RepID=A0ABW2WR54_9ACTN